MAGWRWSWAGAALAFDEAGRILFTHSHLYTTLRCRQFEVSLGACVCRMLLSGRLRSKVWLWWLALGSGIQSLSLVEVMLLAPVWPTPGVAGQINASSEVKAILARKLEYLRAYSTYSTLSMRLLCG